LVERIARSGASSRLIVGCDATLIYNLHLTTIDSIPYTLTTMLYYSIACPLCMLAYAIVYLTQAKRVKNSCYTATEAPFRCRGALLNGGSLESASYLIYTGEFGRFFFGKR
jgi:hypothetical protein